MARPIKETPILFAEDARRFEDRMNEKRMRRRSRGKFAFSITELSPKW